MTPSDRLWKLSLTEPGEHARERIVPHDEMALVLRGLMYGEIPASADVSVAEIVREHELAQAA
jgi:hypothetical protein